MMQLLGKFLVEIHNPPGILVCGLGIFSLSENHGWISYTDPDTMFWEVADIMLLDMPSYGRA